MNRVLRSLLVFGAALLMRCNSPTVAGGATDSPNSFALSGTAVYADSMAVAHATVRLRASDYAAHPVNGAPDAAHDVTTDSAGRYTIADIPSGSYYLEITDQAGRAYGTAVALAGDTALDQAILKPVVSVGGQVSLDHTAARAKIAVQVIGLERVAILPPGDSVFSFDNLPAGAHRLRVSAIEYDAGESTIDLAPLAPGDSSVHNDIALHPFDNEQYSRWRHVSRVLLNTTAAGADVHEDVHDFPALVRLDSTTCDFANVQPGGRDIRFSRPASGTKLPYQIDSWDSAGAAAAVWVLVDTIAGNGITELRMHWGNPAALDLSHGPSVFDTASGFAGVWHMDRRGDVVPEATAHQSHGAAINYGAASAVDGVIGAGLAENAAGHRVEIPDAPHLRLGDAFTLSVWFKGLQYGHFIQKQDSYVLYPHQSSYRIELQLGKDTVGTVHFVSSPLVPGDTGWNYVAAAFDGTHFYWQVNGEYVQSEMSFHGTVVQDTTALSLHKTDLPVDEIRIESVRRGGAWLRLAYENQRPGQRFVSIRP
jgi:hypothetical protein